MNKALMIEITKILTHVSRGASSVLLAFRQIDEFITARDKQLIEKLENMKIYIGDRDLSSDDPELRDIAVRNLAIGDAIQLIREGEENK